MGTAVDEHTLEMSKVVQRIYKYSDVRDPNQTQHLIFPLRRQYEADSYLEAYRTEDELAEQLITDMEGQMSLAADQRDTLHGLIRAHCVNAPVFPDAQDFLSAAFCPFSLS